MITPPFRRALVGALSLAALAAPADAQEPKSKKRGGLAGMMDRLNDWSAEQSMASATVIDLTSRGLAAVSIDSLRFGVTSVAIADSSAVRVVGWLHNPTARPVTIATRVLDSVALLTAEGARLERTSRLGVGKGIHTAPTLTIAANGRTTVTVTYAAPTDGAGTGVLRVASRGAIMPIPLRAPASAAASAAAKPNTSGASSAAPSSPAVPSAPASHAAPATSDEPPALSGVLADLQGAWRYTSFGVADAGKESPAKPQVARGTLVIREMKVTQDLFLGERRHQQQGTIHVSGDLAFVTWTTGETERWRVKIVGKELRVASGADDAARTVSVLAR